MQNWIPLAVAVIAAFATVFASVYTHRRQSRDIRAKIKLDLDALKQLKDLDAADETSFQHLRVHVAWRIEKLIALETEPRRDTAKMASVLLGLLICQAIVVSLYGFAIARHDDACRRARRADPGFRGCDGSTDFSSFIVDSLQIGGIVVFVMILAFCAVQARGFRKLPPPA
ncbi:hypothetical protein [Nocardia abscessus]|uniref:hypothetical protein n=1 Tax=Nocardia abscessus TaxID=120957 RepID=UPI00245534A3|nr:hypothetical protein [Nocardia abscessus]